jgi:hypothetical protein
MIAPQELTAEEVRALVLDVTQRHLKLEVSRYKCDSSMLHNVLLKAAADGQRIEAVGKSQSAACIYLRLRLTDNG